MSLKATILVIACGLAMAFYNVLSKLYQRGDWKNRSALISVAVSTGAAILLFGYSLATGGPRLSKGWLFPVIANGVLSIGTTFAKLRARALEDVSLVTPIDSTTPALVILTAMVIVGEFPTTLGWAGIWVLALGTYALNIQELRQQLLKKGQAEGSQWLRELRIWLAPFLALRHSAGVKWAFFAVALSTLSINYNGLTARRADVGFGFGLVFTIVALGNALIALALREYRGFLWKDFGLRMVVLGIPFAAAIILMGLAFQLALVAYVGAMMRVVIPFTIILAYFMLEEQKSFRQRIAGGIIMSIGAALIALGG